MESVDHNSVVEADGEEEGKHDGFIVVSDVVSDVGREDVTTDIDGLCDKDGSLDGNFGRGVEGFDDIDGADNGVDSIPQIRISLL